MYANDLAITNTGVVLNEDGNSVLIADDDDDNNNPPPLPPEPNLPCMHSIIGEVNEDFQFWCNISNRESETNITHDSDDTNNDTILNQVDDDVWILERYRSNDDNNNFDYNDIDKEILQFKYEDSIGESETIVFHDCDDDLDATQQEEGNKVLEWILKKY